MYKIVGYRLTYDVDIITHLRYYYQRFFVSPGRVELPRLMIRIQVFFQLNYGDNLRLETFTVLRPRQPEPHFEVENSYVLLGNFLFRVVFYSY